MMQIYDENGILKRFIEFKLKELESIQEQCQEIYKHFDHYGYNWEGQKETKHIREWMNLNIRREYSIK